MAETFLPDYTGFVGTRKPGDLPDRTQCINGKDPCDGYEAHVSCGIFDRIEGQKESLCAERGDDL